MKNEIIKYISENKYVTYAQLAKDIPGFYGQLQATHSNDKNIVFWPCGSNDAIDSLNELLLSQKIFLHPAEVLTYVLDGARPSLPLVVKQLANGYKKPHWLPVSFCDFAYQSKKVKK